MKDERDAISYMDCWHLIAPMLLDVGLLKDAQGLKAYVMIFNALNMADKKEKQEDV